MIFRLNQNCWQNSLHVEAIDTSRVTIDSEMIRTLYESRFLTAAPTPPIIHTPRVIKIQLTPDINWLKHDQLIIEKEKSSHLDIQCWFISQ